MKSGDRVVYVGPNSRSLGHKATVRYSAGNITFLAWDHGGDGSAYTSSLALDTETEKPNDEAQAWLDWIKAHPLRNYCRE